MLSAFNIKVFIQIYLYIKVVSDLIIVMKITV